MILGYINLGEILNRYISACANTDGSTSQFTVGLCRQLCCKAGSCPSESPCHVSVLQISDTQAASAQDDKHSKYSSFKRQCSTLIRHSGEKSNISDTASAQDDKHSKYSSNGDARHSGEKSNASVLQISDTRHQLYSGMTNIQHIMPNIDKTQ